jgi:hypothetical protein
MLLKIAARLLLSLDPVKISLADFLDSATHPQLRHLGTRLRILLLLFPDASKLGTQVARCKPALSRSGLRRCSVTLPISRLAAKPDVAWFLSPAFARLRWRKPPRATAAQLHSLTPKRPDFLAVNKSHCQQK